MSDRPPRSERAEELMRGVPKACGVYIMKNAVGEIIYIGKAKELKKRVASYFSRRSTSDDRAAVPLIRGEIARIETIVTPTEREALILESELVREHKPKYNVDLKDDKRFPSLRIDLKRHFPRLEIVRRQKNDGALYFGPYSSAASFRNMIRFINRYFKLRVCSDRVLSSRKKPCLWFYMRRCSAPCVFNISQDKYRAQVERAIMFLKGRFSELIEVVENEMREASEREAYEHAAFLRDLANDLRKSLGERGGVVSKGKDYDAIGFARVGETVCIYVLYIRNGVMRGGRPFIFKRQRIDDEDVVSQFLRRYYEEQSDTPGSVALSFRVESEWVFKDWLSERAGRKIAIIHPRRGMLKELVAAATENARQSLVSEGAEESERERALERLQRLARLPAPPEKIECYDISILSGSEAAASRVVFVGGVPEKSLYRRYRIRSVKGTDDYGMLYEALTRRLKQAKEDSLPDLIVMDGGKGQMNVAIEAMKEQKITGVPVIALAKSRSLEEGERKRTEERIFLPGRKNAIQLKKPSPEKFLLMRIRDEAHRFAIEYHRKLRTKKRLKSELTGIDGVGDKRAKALLRRFGSISKIKSATLDELKEANGIDARTAQIIYDYFHRNSG
ncbi:MAG: excinuclease ABC subunit UvrC [Myxococcota bacterium]